MRKKRSPGNLSAMEEKVVAVVVRESWDGSFFLMVPALLLQISLPSHPACAGEDCMGRRVHLQASLHGW